MRVEHGCAAMCVLIFLLASAGSAAQAQFIPWDTFIDDASDSICDVVNAGNAELVVLNATRQFVIVTGSDVTLVDTFVDTNGAVFFEGEPAGVIGFALDGDGFRTLWWLSLTGDVVEVDGFTGQPSLTNQVPEDFIDVPCDACLFWDDQSVCLIDDDPTDVVVRLCGVDVPIALGVTMLALPFMSSARRARRRCDDRTLTHV